jgi:hypothetical protein
MGLLLSTQTVLAAVETFERDYLYNASENDSKVSARKAALQQLKTLLIEEVGVQVSSSLNIADTVSGDEFNRDVVANYKTFAQALTKTVILEERWNGESFYLKAKVEVDTENLVEQIQLIYQGQVASPVSSVDPCKAKSDTVYELIKNTHRKENVDRLIEIALANPIDEACYRWQWSVLSQFNSLGVENDAYRAYLFEQVGQETASFKGDLFISVLSYAMRLKPLSEQEWVQTKTILSDISKSEVLSVIGVLVNMTQTEDVSKFSLGSRERDARKQTPVQLMDQVSELIRLADSERLGLDAKLTSGDVVHRVFTNVSRKQPSLFIELYGMYVDLLSVSQLQGMASNVYNFFNKKKSLGNAKLLASYLNKVDINTRVSRTFFGLLESLERESAKSEQSRVALTELTRINNAQLSKIVALARTRQKKKNLWAIRYQLSDQTFCSVSECAQQLFDPNKRAQQDAAEYLAAYGDRAVEARNKVLKKLERIRVQFPVQGPTRTIVPLLKVVEAAGIEDARSTSIMLWALGNVDRAVSSQAEASLTANIDEALPHMINSYAQLKSVAQRRMIRLAGKARSNKALAEQFLSGIQPDDVHTQFAIEDATEMLAGDG